MNCDSATFEVKFACDETIFQQLYEVKAADVVLNEIVVVIPGDDSMAEEENILARRDNFKRIQTQELLKQAC